MDTMFNLNENNKSIESLIKHIDSKLINIKNNNKFPQELKLKIQSIYSSIITNWMKIYYLHNIEIEKEDDELLMNKLLDFITYLNNVINEEKNKS